MIPSVGLAWWFGTLLLRALVENAGPLAGTDHSKAATRGAWEQSHLPAWERENHQHKRAEGREWINGLT